MFRLVITVLVIGVTFGLVAASGVNSIMSSMIPGIGPRDFIALGLAAILVFVAGVLAATWPALRASRTDPTMLLKAE